MLNLGHRVRRDEHLPPGHRRQDPAHRRILVLPEPDDQIVHPAQLPAGRIDQVDADDERQVHDRRSAERLGVHHENGTPPIRAGAARPVRLD